MTHEAVYVFSHRRELNFASLLDDKQCIGLPDAEILHILHAHVRADLINSAVRAFIMFAELEAYFTILWRVLILINQHGQEVGHPSDNLQSVGCNGCSLQE